MNDIVPATEQSLPIVEKKSPFSFLQKVPWRIVLPTIFLVVVIAIFFYIRSTRTQNTPIETLQDLRTSSMPPIESEVLRTYVTQKTAATSKPYRPSRETQLQMLEKLEQ